MAPPLSLTWSAPALEDLDEIAAYIALDKPAAAAALVQRVLAAVRHRALDRQAARDDQVIIDALAALPARSFVPGWTGASAEETRTWIARLATADAENLTRGPGPTISTRMSISERLTWPQIRERYPDQWVVLVEHDWDEHLLTVYNTARVLAGGASRAEAIAHAGPALDGYEGYGCRYTGTIRGPMFQLKQFELELK